MVNMDAASCRPDNAATGNWVSHQATTASLEVLVVARAVCIAGARPTLSNDEHSDKQDADHHCCPHHPVQWPRCQAEEACKHSCLDCKGTNFL